MQADNNINTSSITARIRAMAQDMHFSMHLDVLVVDDDELERELLADRLAFCGLKITQARGGKEALDLLKDRWFPIILTDWQMPGMDGIELTEQVRSCGVTDTYVMMLTVLDSEFDYERGYRAGIDDYLSKKLPSTEVLARVHSAFSTLALRRSLKQAQEALTAAGIELPTALPGSTPGYSN